MRWIAYVVLVGCWTGSPPPPAPVANTAPPQPRVVEPAPRSGAKERARELFASGENHYNLGEFADAAHDFEAAYSELPNYVLLYNVAQAYRQAGDRQQALANYQRFLTEGGAQINQHLRDTIDEQIKQLTTP
jgi:tetratricopeptide (TPR) repeat protein